MIQSTKAARRKAQRQLSNSKRRFIKLMKRAKNKFNRIERFATQKALRLLAPIKVATQTKPVLIIRSSVQVSPAQIQNADTALSIASIIKQAGVSIVADAEELVEYCKNLLEMLQTFSFADVQKFGQGMRGGLLELYESFCESLLSRGKPLVNFATLRPQIKKELIKMITFLTKRPNYDISKFKFA